MIKGKNLNAAREKRADYVQRTKDKDGSLLFMGNSSKQEYSRAPSLKYSKEKVMNLEFYTSGKYFSEMKAR